MKQIFKMTAILASGLYLGVTGMSAQGALLFSDDFNDNSLDPAKWSAYGTSVQETLGRLELLSNATDDWGRVNSTPIAVNPTGGLITVTKRSYVHSAWVDLANELAESQFRGRFFLLDPTVDPVVTVITNPPYPPSTYRLQSYYWDYHYNVDYVGFGKDQAVGGLPPLWDQWIDEVITYDPVSGATSYDILGDALGAITVYGSGGMTGSTLQMSIHPDGWYTGHFIYLDSITVEQADAAAPIPPTVLLLAAGVALIGTRRRRGSIGAVD